MDEFLCMWGMFESFDVLVEGGYIGCVDVVVFVDDYCLFCLMEYCL